MLAADTNIPKSDSLYVYKTIIGNSQDGINMALDFLKDHLEGIVARFVNTRINCLSIKKIMKTFHF